MHTTRAFIVVAALAVFGCDKPSPKTIPPGVEHIEMRSGNPIYDYCDVFTCEPCPTGGPCPPPGAESVIHCCNEVGTCVVVELMSSCGPDDYVVICRWGQTNLDGSITCYE